MKVLFENKTKYTRDIYDKFLIFHSNHYKYINILKTASMTFLILFLIIIQVKIHRIHISILLCTVFTVFLLWKFFYPFFKVSKEYQSDKIQKEKIFNFKFYEKNFTIEDGNVISHVSYFKLHKVFETKDFVYLYMDQTHAFLVSKDGFLNGSYEKFSIFIKKKCWYKYKLINK